MVRIRIYFDANHELPHFHIIHQCDRRRAQIDDNNNNNKHNNSLLNILAVVMTTNVISCRIHTRRNNIVYIKSFYACTFVAILVIGNYIYRFEGIRIIVKYVEKVMCVHNVIIVP